MERDVTHSETQVVSAGGRRLDSYGKRALGASLGIHGALFTFLLFSPVLFRPKPYIVEHQVLMAEFIEIEPPGEQPEPEKAPSLPNPKPPPKVPPKTLPEPKSKPKPKKTKSQLERERMLRELEERRKRDDSRAKRVQVPRDPEPLPQHRVSSPRPVNPVQVKGKSFPYDYYLVLVKNALWDAWRPPQAFATEGIHAVVSFQIMRNGTIPPDQIAMGQSSGLSAYDQSCLKAVQNAQLPPLPQDYGESNLSLNCVFRSEEM